MLHYESHDILVIFFYKLKFIKIENQLTLGSNPKNMQYSIFKSTIYFINLNLLTLMSDWN